MNKEKMKEYDEMIAEIDKRMKFINKIKYVELDDNGRVVKIVGIFTREK